MRLTLALTAAAAAVLSNGALAQTTTGTPQHSTPVGEFGQRQTRDLNQRINPIGRVNNRIDNRVDLRLATRLDRSYRAQAGAGASIERATRKVDDALRATR